jgi:hypothetical protein
MTTPETAAPVDAAPANEAPPSGARERIARMMYRGVPPSQPIAHAWALADALSSLGLAANQLGPIDKAALPDLLARAFGANYANTPDLVWSLLMETARELRFVHRAVLRGKCNAVVMFDVRDTIATAAARVTVAAELHHRMLVGLSIYDNERAKHLVDKARRGEGGAP